MKKIPINHKILKPVREIAGYSLDEMALKFKKIREWEKGKDYPTYRQLELLAKKYEVYLAVFFFPNTTKKELLKYYCLRNLCNIPQPKSNKKIYPIDLSKYE